MTQLYWQFFKSLNKGVLTFTLVPPAIWQQLTDKVCFTQVDVRTTCKRPDTPTQIKLYPERTIKGEVIPESIGYTELLGRGRTAVELIAHRDAIDALGAAQKAALAYVKEQRKAADAVTAELLAMGIEF